MDEALSGRTGRSTPIHPRSPDYFPAEARDLFWEMDWVADATTGEPRPLDFDANRDGTIDENERHAIRGRNTWLLWGGGNEAFWGWLQERGYGINDFLVLMDSRRRNERFRTAGLINQPGFESVTRPEDTILGLYIDRAKGDGSNWLRPPGHDERHAETKDAYGRPVSPPVPVPPLPHGGIDPLFEPGDRKLYDEVVARLPRDGVDYSVYGYPSGIFGLRLLPNPDFFGNTEDAARARALWDSRVTRSSHADYYSNPDLRRDPDLVRPFRVAMSCGFCHVGPHPLYPPKDPENPTWRNLSGIIGAQYWAPQPAFANNLERSNFLFHFLASQPPGTIDTSLVSTDQLNNTNVINAIFDVPARLNRAETKPPELQAGDNLLFLGKSPADEPAPTHCPMVLFPGEDSCGIIPALARVPLNIGVFSEQWARCDNPIIGFTPQRPFRVATNRTNSVYWMVNERYRVPYMAAFFTLGGDRSVPKSTAAMLLRDADPEEEGGRPRFGPDGRVATKGAKELAKDESRSRERGRSVFLDNCALCHSSRQPAGFDLRFAREMERGWDQSPAPRDGEPPIYTLPMSYADWEAFRRSPALADYRRRIHEIAGDDSDEGRDPFLVDNFLSNELRIPITLVGTNASRSLATNAIRGNVWDNFSSETFKNLPSVGRIRFFNVASGMPADSRDGSNDEFDDGRESGGPGYMRPPSLISLWATAPYFHNNALGLYNQNPSVAGRLESFEDGIRKLLNQDLRAGPSRSRHFQRDDHEATWTAPGDLRDIGSASAKDDPGYIYRLPVDTHIEFAAGYTRQLISGVVGETVFAILSVWLWVALVAFFSLVAWKGQARHAGILVLVLAAAFVALLAFTGMGEGGGTAAGAMMMLATDWMDVASIWLWAVPLAVAALGLWLCLSRRDLRKWILRSFAILAVVTAFGGWLAHKFLDGRLKDRNPLIAALPNDWIDGDFKGISVGPIPRGTPVDLMMNIDPEKSREVAAAGVALAKAMIRIKRERLTGDAAYAVLREVAGEALVAASKCPDFVLDRGHWFGEALDSKEKEDLVAYLKTF